MKIIIYSFIYLIALSTFAQASTTCGIKEIRKHNTLIRSVELSQGHCAISVDPVYPITSELIYRSYMFSDESDIFVFESYGNGPDNTHTATQVYYLFPRKNSFSAKIDSNNIASISIPAANDIKINLETARIESFLGLEYSEDASVSPESNGGFKIKSFKGIFLKTGYQVGGVAHLNPNGYSSFVDQSGKQCSVKNDLIFEYEGRTSFKFKTDLDLKNFLIKTCKYFDVSMLN